MKFAGKTVLICVIGAALVLIASVISQRRQLSDNIIRLHVVANSDSYEDQNIKLQLRDAVTKMLTDEMADAVSCEQAAMRIQKMLPQIEAMANRTLRELGSTDTARASLGQEEFDTRYYDTFSLPAGVYQSLRIVIGEGEGKNWWCVVFPELCVPATAQGFEEKAVQCGYSDSLTGALTGQNGYEVRFFLLDCLGRLENFFFAG